MGNSPWKFFGSLSLVLLVGSCVASDSPTDLGSGASVGIDIQPALIPTPADGDALPINRIRVSVSRVADGLLLTQSAVEVSPTDTVWTVDVGVPEQYASETVYVFVRLLNAPGDDTESVQFSGRSAAITLVPGEQISPDIPIVRGPIANLFATGVSITSAPATMVAGQSQALAAAVTTSGPVPPTVYWTSLDPTVLTVSGATATAVAGGSTQVIASAGAFADTVTIQVFGLLTLTTASLPGGTQGVAYSQTLAATGGDGAYTWSVTAGSLPAALAIAPATGVISGTPTTVENASFTVQVQSGDGQTATRPLTIAVIDDVPAGFSVTESGASTDVDESGTTDTVAVVLLAQPATDVVLTVSSGDTGEATVSPASLTFTNANWNAAQSVIVTGVDDAAVDGDQLTDVTISVNDGASDDTYDPVPDDIVTVTTTDDDIAGFTVTETGGATTVDESGTTDTFTVVLDVQPISDVVFDVGSADPAEVTVSPATLTFTGANWSTPQVVTVSGVDDAAVDGNQATNITVSVNDALSQAEFAPLVDQVVSATTTDDDVAGRPVIRWGSGNSGSWNAPSNWTPAQVPVAGDSVVIDAAATFTVFVDQDIQVSYLTLGNPGGTQTLQFLSGQTLTIDSAAVVTPNGVIDLTDGILTGPGTITSSGTILKPAGAGLSVIEAFFENNGSVDVQQGQLELLQGTVHDGDFSMGSGTLLRFTDADTLGINGDIIGSGVLELAGSPSVILRTTGTVDVGSLRVLSGSNFIDGPVAISDTLRISQGSFRPFIPATDQLRYLFMDSRFGSLGGRLTVEVTDSLDISQGVINTQGVVRTMPGVPAVFPAASGASAPRVGSPLELQGPSLWTSGNIRLEGAAGIFDVLNGGTLDITGAGSFEPLSANGAFVRIRPAASMTKSGGGVTVAAVPLVNDGFIDLQSGTWQFTDSLTNNGTIEVDANAILDLDAPAVHAAGALLRGNGTVDVDDMVGGELSGDIAPGTSPGVLNWISDYDPSPTHRLLIELGGSTPGTYDVLNITNQSVATGTFAGTLVIDTLSGFVPAAGDTIPVLTFDERMAPFTTVTFPSGIALDTLWTNNVGLGARDTLYVVASGGPPGVLNSWTGGGANSAWSNPANWSGSVPTALDSVVVQGASNFGILLDQDAQVQSLTIGTGGGGHLLTANGFNLRASANIVIGATGAVTMGPTDTISTGGTISVLGTGFLALEGSTIDGALYNEGELSVQNSSSITGALTTGPTSVITIEGNGGTEGDLSLAAGFTNNGLIELTDTGGGYATIYLPGPLVNSGTGTIRALASASAFSRFLFGVLDNRGTVEISENFSLSSPTGTHLNSGTITVTDGLFSVLMNQSSFTNAAGGAIEASGTGGVQVIMPNTGAPSFTHAGGITIAAGLQFTLSGAAGSFDIAGGVIDNGGTLSISGGMGVTSTTDFTHTGPGTLSLVVANWNGPGTLTNAPGATLQLGQVVISTDLENQGTVDLISTATVQGQLIVPAGPTGTFSTASTNYPLAVAGVDVDGAVFDRVPLEINGAAIAGLDNVTFQNMSAFSTQLWVTHPGAATPFVFDGLVFTQPTNNAFIRADDSDANNGNVLTINLTNSDPADGSANTTVNGAVVNW